ncbi:MAG: hypothetical protein ACK5UP_07645 [Bacteroidota bacterium]
MIEGKKSRVMLNRCSIVVLFATLYTLLSSCSTDQLRPSNDLYFPLSVGVYWIYDVEETNILRLACNDNGETVAR